MPPSSQLRRRHHRHTGDRGLHAHVQPPHGSSVRMEEGRAFLQAPEGQACCSSGTAISRLRNTGNYDPDEVLGPRMRADDVRTFSVLGSGLMVTGIPLSFAAARNGVRLFGRNPARVEPAMDTLDRDSQLLAPDGQGSAFGGSVRARVHATTDLRAAVDD